MNKYKYLDEEKILFYYADNMGNIEARTILEKRGVKNENEAKILSSFYWTMADD